MGTQRNQCCPVLSLNPLALVVVSWAELSHLFVQCVPNPRPCGLVSMPNLKHWMCLLDFAPHLKETLKTTMLAVCQILTRSNTTFVLEYGGIG